jgi:hypothetical protein
MRKIFLLSIFILFGIVGYSQKIVSVSNPLEKILQNDFDSSIIYSIKNNWDSSPNYFIISKISDKIYFYRYSINHKSYYGGGVFSPRKSELSNKLIDVDVKFKMIEPDINPYFKWIDTELEDSSIWREIIKYELWNLTDDRNIKIKSDIKFEISDGVGLEFKLITKDKIIQLKYYEPEFYNQEDFNQSRDNIVKIEKIIRGFYKKLRDQSTLY